MKKNSKIKVFINLLTEHFFDIMYIVREINFLVIGIKIATFRQNSIVKLR